MTLLYRLSLHFLYTIQNNHLLFYFSVSQKHPRFRLAILICNLEMWRSYCNMKTAAWNYDDLWLGSAFSNGVFNTTQISSSGCRWFLILTAVQTCEWNTTSAFQKTHFSTIWLLPGTCICIKMHRQKKRQLTDSCCNWLTVAAAPGADFCINSLDREKDR